MWLDLLDLSQPFPISSGGGAQATQTLLEKRPGRFTAQILSISNSAILGWLSDSEGLVYKR